MPPPERCRLPNSLNTGMVSVCPGQGKRGTGFQSGPFVCLRLRPMQAIYQPAWNAFSQSCLVRRQAYRNVFPHGGWGQDLPLAHPFFGPVSCAPGRPWNASIARASPPSRSPGDRDSREESKSMEDFFQHFLRQSGPVLCLDIGSGTQDALLARPNLEVENWPHFVLPSPARIIAQRLRELALLKRDVWLCGRNMGGGFLPAVRACLESGRRVYATRAASTALNNDPERVQALGVVLAEERPAGTVPVHLADYSAHAWSTLLRAAGLPVPHLVLASAQDHGYQGGGHGNRTVRMNRFASMLAANPDPVSWVFRQPPAEMTRLQTLHESTGGPVADSATAMVLGAMVDDTVRKRSFRQGVTLVNVGNGHIFAALLYRGLVRGIYEHHTGMRTRDELLADLREFRRCFLPTEVVQASGGHGTAYGPLCEEAGGYEPTFVCGPQRALLSGYGQPIAPFGSMMLAGALGLLWGCASICSAGQPAGTQPDKA